MSATLITVTGTFVRPDEVFASGKVIARLSNPIENGGDTIDAAAIVGALNDVGVLVAQDGVSPYQLVANDDVDTAPQGTYYHFLVQLDNAVDQTFNASIPANSPAGTIDFTQLSPLVTPGTQVLGLGAGVVHPVNLAGAPPATSGYLVGFDGGGGFITVPPTGNSFIEGTDITTGTTDPPGTLPDGSVYVESTDGVNATKLFLTPGISNLQVFTVTVAPTLLGFNQCAILVDGSGNPLGKLYFGVHATLSTPVTVTFSAGSSYTLPNATTTVLGGVKLGATGATGAAKQDDFLASLNTLPQVTYAATHTLAAGDLGSEVVCTGTFTLTLPAGLTAKGFCAITVDSGTVTLQPSSVTLNGSSSVPITITAGQTYWLRQRVNAGSPTNPSNVWIAN